MKHSFELEVIFKTEGELDTFMKYLYDFERTHKVTYFKHSTDCPECQGTGEVGAKGIYMDCKECGGGANVVYEARKALLDIVECDKGTNTADYMRNIAKNAL